MKVLLIDWSYFMPQADSENIIDYSRWLPPAAATLNWISKYREDKSAGRPLDKLKVNSKLLDQFRTMLNNQIRVFGLGCTDNTVHLGEFLLDAQLADKIKKEGLEITLITDHVATSEQDCSSSGLHETSWLTAVIAKYPETKCKLITNREELKSDTRFEVIELDKLESEYSLMYLAKSSYFTYPHLDKEFSALARFMIKRADAVLLRDEMQGRYDNEMKAAINK